MSLEDKFERKISGVHKFFIAKRLNYTSVHVLDRKLRLVVFREGKAMIISFCAEDPSKMNLTINNEKRLVACPKTLRAFISLVRSMHRRNWSPDWTMEQAKNFMIAAQEALVTPMLKPGQDLNYRVERKDRDGEFEMNVHLSSLWESNKTKVMSIFMKWLPEQHAVQVRKLQNFKNRSGEWCLRLTSKVFGGCNCEEDLIAYVINI